MYVQQALRYFPLSEIETALLHEAGSGPTVVHEDGEEDQLPVASCVLC